MPSGVAPEERWTCSLCACTVPRCSDGGGVWAVTSSGPRDIWEEIQGVAARWRAAGQPAAYRLEFGPGGEQWASA
ncbi:hypothetical protein LUW77_01675 [Streptomyces radiopugnans]|nr:hypothetical protein LUW77_01675 [Streptomyces radiopugnans]